MAQPVPHGWINSHGRQGDTVSPWEYVHANLLGSYLAEIPAITFDPIAVLDKNTLGIVFRNHAFRELTRAIGMGDDNLGLSRLSSLFLNPSSLMSPPADPTCTLCTVHLGGQAVTLWSTCKMIRSPSAEAILWVLHRPWSNSEELTVQQDGRSMQENSEHKNTDNGNTSEQLENTTFINNANNQAEDALPYPKASDQMDPTVKVRCGLGKGRREIQLQWRKYGEKILTKPKGKHGTAARQVERLYYRCYMSDCNARLRIDVDKQMQERLSVHATGVHNHYLRMVV